jgi:hypothetical protein
MADREEMNCKNEVVGFAADFEHSLYIQKHIFNHNTDYIPNVSPSVSLPSH